jgi:hypothetical protein
MRTAIVGAALLALACNKDKFDDSTPDVPVGTAQLEVSYDAATDQPVLSWSTVDERSCVINDHDVDTEGADVPVAAPEKPGFVSVALTCTDGAGRTSTSTVRLWWGPDAELVVGGGGGVTLTELLPLDLVHGSLRLAGPVSAPSTPTPVFDVTRDLTIADGAGQTGLGLPLPVQDVYGDLVIEDDELTSLQEYRASRFRGGLVIRGAGGLDDLSSFPDEATTIPGDLALLENPHLASLAGLDRLSRIGGDLQVIGNDALVELADDDDAGLSGLDTVDGSIVVQGNPALRALWSRGAQLEDVGGSISVIGNPVLIEAKGLGGLTSLPGDLVLRDDDALSVFPSLFVTEIGGDLVIRGNAALAEIGVFGVLARVDGDLIVEEDDALDDLDFLAAVQAIGGSLSVADDLMLADVAGLSAVTSIAGDASFSGNPQLCPDEVEALLAGIDVGGLATQVTNGADASCP